jgi:signal transduction histidine kinase
VLVPPVAALAAVLASIAVSARAMYLDAEQSAVVLAACAGGAAVGLVAAVLLGLKVRRLEDDAAGDRAARLAAETAERARQELLAALTHDLRTPLAGIRAMAEALEDGVAGDQDGYLAQIRAEADRTAAMVQDMFSLARLQAGLDHGEAVEVVVADLAEAVVEQARPVARAAGVALVIGERSAEGVPAAAPSRLRVRAPAGCVERVLANLVDNAVRETAAAGPGGRVVVDVAGEDPGVVLRVEDSCGGIADDDLPHLFEAGWRGARARTPDGGGAGLGLAVVAELVSGAGGRVSVSQTPTGCSFAVRLPAAGPVTIR